MRKTITSILIATIIFMFSCTNKKDEGFLSLFFLAVTELSNGVAALVSGVFSEPTQETTLESNEEMIRVFLHLSSVLEEDSSIDLNMSTIQREDDEFNFQSITDVQFNIQTNLDLIVSIVGNDEILFQTNTVNKSANGKITVSSDLKKVEVCLILNDMMIKYVVTIENIKNNIFLEFKINKTFSIF